jgi:hypothetical protein
VPVTVEEKFESRSSTTGPNASVDLIYTARGSNDDLEVKTEIEAASPDIYDNLPRQSISIEPVGDLLWEATVRYSLSSNTQPPPTGGSTFSFDTGGGTRHITQSLATVASYAPLGQTPPDFKGAIGVTNDSVEGVDIAVPVYNFAETHYLPDSQVTDQYKGVLFGLTGKVNDAPFRGFAAGECLFLGASGSKRSDSDWEISFRFAASPNATNLTVGDITGIAKKGWEYLWVRYADAVDDTAKALVKKPVAAYVEQVYEFGNFAALGI